MRHVSRVTEFKYLEHVGQSDSEPGKQDKYSCAQTTQRSQDSTTDPCPLARRIAQSVGRGAELRKGEERPSPTQGGEVKNLFFSFFASHLSRLSHSQTTIISFSMHLTTATNCDVHAPAATHSCFSVVIGASTERYTTDYTCTRRRDGLPRSLTRSVQSVSRPSPSSSPASQSAQHSSNLGPTDYRQLAEY